jgi:hypothetical protein
MSMSRTHETYFEREDGTEVCVEYTITPYDPGVSSGPAEICYPPEGGEVEIISVKDESGKSLDWTADEDQKWSVSIFENHDFDDGPDPDWEREVRWEDERDAN